MNPNENNAGFTKGSFYLQISLLCLLSLSLIDNVLLGWKVKFLLLKNTSLQNESDTRPMTGMKIGELNVATLSGKKSVLLLSGQQSTILYIFRPNCKWCGLNLSSIRSLSQQRGLQVRFIGISTSANDVQPYLNKYPLPFPVYIADNREELSKFHFIGTPQTVEISNKGEVVQNWVGAYEPDTAVSIEKQLSVKLPVLQENPATN